MVKAIESLLPPTHVGDASPHILHHRPCLHHRPAGGKVSGPSPLETI